MFQLGHLTPQTPSAHAILREKVGGLFEQFHLPIFRYVMCKTRNSSMAEDITQESFLRLYRHLSDQRPVENPKAWLFAVAHNLAVDSMRGESQFKALDESTWEQMEDSGSRAQNDHEKTMLEQERRELLRKAVMELTPLQRECLHLRAEGLRLREIAELLRISISTVADAIRRATAKLARVFSTEVSQ
jgi:RNA polymerase sigma-70 factor (ECF subfamily)